MSEHQIIKFVGEIKMYVSKIDAMNEKVIFVSDENSALSLHTEETVRVIANFVSRCQKGIQIITGTAELCRAMTWKKLLLLNGYAARNN